MIISQWYVLIVNLQKLAENVTKYRLHDANIQDQPTIID